MKKEIVKMLALLLFGAAALSSCAIDNARTHRRYNNNGQHDNNRGHHDRGYNNNGGYNHSNY